MAKETVKKPSTVETADLRKADRSDFDNDTNLAQQLLPYWNPEVGDSMVATPVNIDIQVTPAANADEEPYEFVRIEMIAHEDIRCFRGAKDEDGKPEEEVIVREGEHFNISPYHGLRITPAIFGFKLCITAVEKKKVKRDPKRNVWVWTMKPRTADIPALREAQEKERAALKAKLPQELRA